MRRKDFLRLSALFGGGIFSGSLFANTDSSRPADIEELIADSDIDGSMFNYADMPIPKVRVAVVGLGNRGTTLIQMLDWLVRNNHCEIVAICDVQPKYIERAKSIISKFQTVEPRVIDGSEDEMAWKEMCNIDIPDLLLVATP